MQNQLTRRDYFRSYQRKYRAKETLKQRTSRLESVAVYVSIKRARETVSEREARKKKHKLYMRVRRDEKKKHAFLLPKCPEKFNELSEYVFLIKVHSYSEFKFGESWYIENLFDTWTFQKSIFSKFHLAFGTNEMLSECIKTYMEEVRESKFEKVKIVLWKGNTRKTGFCCPICYMLFQVKRFYRRHLAEHYFETSMNAQNLIELLSPSLKCVSSQHHDFSCFQ